MILTYLPSDSAPECINAFTVGQWNTSNEPFRWMADKALSFLQRAPRRVILFKDTVFAAGELLVPYRSHVVTVKNAVYACVPSETAELTSLDSAKRDAKADAIGFLTTLPSHITSILERRTLEEYELSDLAKMTRMIVLQAYDGEGYIVWCEQRTAAQSPL